MNIILIDNRYICIYIFFGQQKYVQSTVKVFIYFIIESKNNSVKYRVF